MAVFPDDIEFNESGDGPTVLFLPGSFGTGAGWKPIINELGNRFRFVTTSLLGYGATTERRDNNENTTRQQIHVIDKLFQRIAEPVNIVAHSYGGLCALAHAIEGSIKPVSLTLIEANPLEILKTSGEYGLYANFSNLTRDYFKAFESGDQDAARHVIDFYGGKGSFDAFPARVRDYIKLTTPTNILDWSSGTSFRPPLSDYKNITASTYVIRGGKSHPAMMRIAELLAENIHNSCIKTIDSGSHFLPETHPIELAHLINCHIRELNPPIS